MGKDSFVLYTRYAKHIKKLNNEQRGVLLTAIFAYETGEALPDMDDKTDMIFGVIVEDIELCNEKWEQTRKARAEAGRKGGLATQAKASKNKQKKAKPSDANHNVYVNVNGNGIKNKEKEILKEKETRYGEFENVILTDDEYTKLVERYPMDYQERIENLSLYLKKTGKRYKSHYATILSWARKDGNASLKKKGRLDWIDDINWRGMDAAR